MLSSALVLAYGTVVARCGTTDRPTRRRAGLYGTGPAGVRPPQVRIDQSAVAHLLPAAIIDRDRFRFLRA